jgi:acid phosphatase
MCKYLLMVSIIFSITAKAQVQPNKNGYVHPLIIPTHFTALTSVSLNRYKGQDTFLITANTAGWSLQQDSGIDWNHPLVFINISTKKIRVDNGIDAQNCRYIKIIGFGSDSAYGFEFVGGILIEGCHITHGGAGGLWVKEEAPQACQYFGFWSTKGTADSLKYGVINNYLAPNFQDSVFVRHNWIDSCGGDGYFGSTGTIHGREPVNCLPGSPARPTMQTRNFHIDSNYINYFGRSGIQLNLAVAGNQTINDNIITNCGYEFAQTNSPDSKNQGAGIRTGSGDINVEIARNTVDYTNLYNYDIEEAGCNFHDNFGDHVSLVNYKGLVVNGGQALASVIAASADPQTSPLLIRSNQMFHTTAGGNVAYAIYGGSNFTLSTNDTCFNVGKVSVLATPFVALPTCSSAGCDTTFSDSTFTVQHDSPEVAHFPPTVITKDTVLISPTGIDTNFNRNHNYITRVTFGKPRDSTYLDTIRAAYDSAYICSLCASHDTTISVTRILCSGMKPSHVIVVMMENHGYNQIIGSASAPYINSLANSGMLFSNMHGVAHPSQPNYIALFSGDTQGITDDSCRPRINAANLYTELNSIGKTFAWYSEDLPAQGDTVCAAAPYVRRHNASAIFSNVPNSRNKRFVDFPTNFDSLQNLVFISPNLNNDMHNGTIAQGDTWLQTNLSSLVTWCNTHNSIFIIDFDEDNGTPGNQIPMVASGQYVLKSNNGNNYNHYSLTKTLCGLFNAPIAWTTNLAAASLIVFF